MSRRLWANLIYTAGRYYFSLNEEVAGDPTLLLLLIRTNQESLEEFLLRSKQEAQEQLRVSVEQLFLLIDFDSSGGVVATQESRSSVKREVVLGESSTLLTTTNCFTIAPQLATEIQSALQRLRLQIVALEFGVGVLAAYLSRHSRDTPLLLLQTQESSLNLTEFSEGRLVASVEIKLNWEGLIEELQRALKLPKSQIELVLLSGVDLGSLAPQLHPHIKVSVCVWHLKRFLGPPLRALLKQVSLNPQQRVVVTGFLAKVNGFGDYLKRLSARPRLQVESRGGGTTSGIHFLNRAFNYVLWAEGQLGHFYYNTGDIAIKLRRSNRMFQRLGRFFGLWRLS